MTHNFELCFIFNCKWLLNIPNCVHRREYSFNIRSHNESTLWFNIKIDKTVPLCEHVHWLPGLKNAALKYSLHLHNLNNECVQSGALNFPGVKACFQLSVEYI